MTVASLERVPEQASVDVAAPLERSTNSSRNSMTLPSCSQAAIVEEQENERIVWTNEDEEATAVVTFHRLDDPLTRVMVSYDPSRRTLPARRCQRFTGAREACDPTWPVSRHSWRWTSLEARTAHAPSDGDQDAPRGSPRRQEESSQEEPES